MYLSGRTHQRQRQARSWHPGIDRSAPETSSLSRGAEVGDASRGQYPDLSGSREPRFAQDLASDASPPGAQVSWTPRKLRAGTVGPSGSLGGLSPPWLTSGGRPFNCRRSHACFVSCQVDQQLLDACDRQTRREAEQKGTPLLVPAMAARCPRTTSSCLANSGPSSAQFGCGAK